MNWRQFIRVMKRDERGAQAKYRVDAKAAKSQAIRDIFDKLAYEEEPIVMSLRGLLET